MAVFSAIAGAASVIGGALGTSALVGGALKTGAALLGGKRGSSGGQQGGLSFDPRVGVVSGSSNMQIANPPESIQAAKTFNGPDREEENEAVTLAKKWAQRLTIGN